MGVNSQALYSCLLEDLGDAVPGFSKDYSEAWPDITPREFAALTLSKTFYKKFVEVKSPDADQRAFDKFQQVNSDCGTWELCLQSSKDEVLLGELKETLSRFWNLKNRYPLVSNHHQIFDEGRCGPGSSVGAMGKDFYTKLYASPLTATSSLLVTLYEDYITNRPEMLAAEIKRQETYGPARIVEGSKLHFVNKTNDISRLICSEPTLNMYVQLGFGRILEDRLRRFFGIDLSDQPDKNRELARRGSISDDRCTIDLESASDSLSLRMLSQILPPDFLRWLEMMRCPKTQLGEVPVALNMVSTMGNGTTFPLQTIIFASVVSAAARFRRIELHNPNRDRLGNWAVFGDDIIVKREIVDDVIRLLTLLGFKVNQQKSFIEGPFRESCGADWFKGQYVRGVYIKRLRTQQDRYVAINNLNLWSAVTGIPLRRTVGYLAKRVRFLPVPPWENLDGGLRVPYVMVDKLRWDRHVHSIRYRVCRAFQRECESWIWIYACLEVKSAVSTTHPG
jgi:hypothetical protein